MSFRPRSAAGVASLALVSLLGLSACTSTPSHRRVVLDQIEALDQLDGLRITNEQQACMRDVVGTYENGALDDIATAGNNEDINWNDENALASASPELQEFVQRLGECMTGDAESTATTEAMESTEASDTAEASETTESADTTEATDTTDASGTEAVDTTEA